MSANFAAVDALTEFLRGNSEPRFTENAFEKLGLALGSASGQGVPMKELLEKSGLNRTEFVAAWVDGVKAGLFEQAGEGESARFRLTAQGRSIY